MISIPVDKTERPFPKIKTTSPTYSEYIIINRMPIIKMIIYDMLRSCTFLVFNVFIICGSELIQTIIEPTVPNTSYIYLLLLAKKKGLHQNVKHFSGDQLSHIS